MEDDSLNKKVTFQKVLLFLKGNCPTVFMKKCLIGIHQLVKIKTGKGLSFKKKICLDGMTSTFRVENMGDFLLIFH